MSQARTIRFDGWVLRRELGELLKDGRRIRLQDQPLQLLDELLAHPGELVTREQLIACLWPKGVVDFDAGLNSIVHKLRIALQDEAETPRYIETVPRKGYRFIGTIEPPLVEPPQAPQAAHLQPGSLPEPPATNAVQAPVGVLEPRSRAAYRAYTYVAAIAAALFRGRGYGLLSRVEVLPNESPRRDRAGWVTRIGIALSFFVAAAVALWILLVAPRAMHEASSTAAREGTSIAVLPFADLSAARDQQYLADGIAEEILNLLSKATTLRVIARTSSFSFRDKDADVTSIAKALGVTHVLEGSVRKAGERIRVTVRLVDVSDGSRLWSESYDQRVGDILALQTDVARSVAAQLKANLQSVADVAARRVNTEAYELYLHGQQQVRKWRYTEAARYFERAIAIDSELIPAYNGLGLAYVMEVVDVRVPVAENRERLRQILSRGLRLAPDDPGLLALSAQLARYDGEIRLAEERFETALQRDPSNSVVRSLYAMFKLDQGDPEAALRLGRRSLEIDPFNPINYVVVWVSHLDLWNEKESLAAAAHYQELAAPLDPTGDTMAANTRMLLAGDIAGAITDFKKGLARVEQQYPGTPVWLPLLYYAIGDLRTGDALLEAARQTPYNRWWINHGEVYRAVVHDDIDEARRLAAAALTKQKVWGGGEHDMIVLRLVIDGMIASGEAQRAVDLLETMAPEYARYKARKDIAAKDLSPAPVPVKSAFTTYPALYFPDYIRALRAVGDEAGANQMLDHLDAVLALRRQRGLFIEERHAAEALALRGRTEAALDALEKAERDRTIYHWWQLELLHNEIFAELRNHPRFLALVERGRSDLSRQRDELSRVERVGADSR